MRNTFLPLIVIFVSACAAFPARQPIEAPQVDVTSVAITTMNTQGLFGAIDLKVANPNLKAVPLTSVDWELTIGRSQTILGRSDVRATIPARSSAPVVAHVTLDAHEMVLIEPLIARGERDYRLRTTVHFNSPLGDVPVTVEKDGTLR